MVIFSNVLLSFILKHSIIFANRSRREHAISRKRKEYVDSIPMFFDVSEFDRTTQEGETLRSVMLCVFRVESLLFFMHRVSNMCCEIHAYSKSKRASLICISSHFPIYSQIQVDLPRTNPDMPFFQQKQIQRAMERVLYIWSIRHPASSYVQGMNDLLCPLLLVAMYPYAQDVLRCDVATLNPQVVFILFPLMLSW